MCSSVVTERAARNARACRNRYGKGVSHGSEKYLKLTTLTAPVSRCRAACPHSRSFHGSHPDLVVARGAAPGQIVKAAVDALGGIEKFISPGDIVVVKQNVGWDRLPEQADNTNAEVVTAVVKLCFDAEAKKIKAFSRPVNDPGGATSFGLLPSFLLFLPCGRSFAVLKPGSEKSCARKSGQTCNHDSLHNASS